MPKSYGQKLKILYLAQLLLERSDETHPITTREMIDHLAAHGIHAERKSIYDDMDALQSFGLDIISIREKPGGYYLASRKFELPELKLLVDAVQASKFVTIKKSRELIHKLETLTSRSEAGQLHRQVVVAARGKSSNEQIYYNVDEIYTAMAANHMIRFQYCEWSAQKELVPRKNGTYYEVSPWLLTWEDENYYLIAYDHVAAILKYYRVDKMLHLSVSEQLRQGQSTFEALDIASFAKKTFGMFAGDETVVTLRCDTALAGVMIDRFGRDVPIRPVSEGQIQVRASIAVSRQFFGWLAGLGNNVQIVSPPATRTQYKQYLNDILDLYNNDKEEFTMKLNHEFSNYKSCSMCGRTLPIDYEKEFCPACEDDVLFKEVREYIRSHDVTEFQLAEVFNIPQNKVRKWIKEGRIEYVTGENKMMNTQCQRCGTPVSFGTLCPDCMRIMNGNKEISYTMADDAKIDRNRMRFLKDYE